MGLAYLIRRLTAGPPGSLVGSVPIAVFGAGAIGSAVFPRWALGFPAAALVLLSCRARARWSGSCSGC